MTSIGSFLNSNSDIKIGRKFLTNLEVLEKATQITETMAEKYKKEIAFTAPMIVKDYVKRKLAPFQANAQEAFAVCFLDSQHGLIKFEIMFTGTIDGASVYPRMVVKRALELNAAAVILTHNHPSGESTPSNADKMITERLEKGLALVDIKVLDHIIVGSDVLSFAERGYI